MSSLTTELNPPVLCKLQRFGCGLTQNVAVCCCETVQVRDSLLSEVVIDEGLVEQHVRTVAHQK